MTFLLANGAICLFALMAVVFRKPLCKLIFSAATAVMSLVCCVWLKQLFDMGGGADFGSRCDIACYIAYAVITAGALAICAMQAWRLKSAGESAGD